MPKALKDRLIDKGWSEAEAHKVHETLYTKETPEKHKIYKKSINLTLYWTSLIVLVICNLVVSVVLVPFLLMLKSWVLDLIIVVLGIIFGLLFNHVIHDIEHVEVKHHLFAAVLIPALSIVNLFMIVNVANRFALVLEMDMHSNPLFISLLYAVAFITPYILSTIKNEVLKKKGR